MSPHDDFADLGFVPDDGVDDAGALGFKPDAAAPPTGPTKGASVARGVAQGATLGFGDEFAGGVQAALQFLATHPGFQRVLTSQWGQGDKDLYIQPNTDATGAAPVPTGDVYQAARDVAREKNAAAEAAHPGAYLAGNLAGGILTAPLLPGGSVKSLGQAAKTGAALGAVQGLGSSDADTVEGMAQDTLIGAGVGAGTAGTIHGGAQALADVAPALERAGINQARRVLTNGADSLSSRAALSADAVQEALESGAIKFGGTTKGALDRLEGLTEAQGKKYAEIISKLEALGVKGPYADEIASDLIARGRALLPHTMEDALPAEYLEQAKRVLRKPQGGDRLGLEQAEDLKRSLQNQARYGKVEETPLNEVRRDIASQMRQATEDAVERGMEANPASTGIQEAGAEFVPAKQRLGRLIGARDAAARGAARGAQRRAFGLSDNLMMAAGLASGNPAGVAQGLASAVGNNVLRNRGTSAAAVSLYGAGKALSGDFIQHLAETQPSALGRWAGTLTRALQGGPDEFSASHYVLSQTDPDYQEHMRQLATNAEAQQD